MSAEGLADLTGHVSTAFTQRLLREKGGGGGVLHTCRRREGVLQAHARAPSPDAVGCPSSPTVESPQ